MTNFLNEGRGARVMHAANSYCLVSVLWSGAAKSFLVMHDIEDDLVSLVGFKPKIPIQSISPIKESETENLNFCVAKTLLPQKMNICQIIFMKKLYVWPTKLYEFNQLAFLKRTFFL